MFLNDFSYFNYTLWQTANWMVYCKRKFIRLNVDVRLTQSHSYQYTLKIRPIFVWREHHRPLNNYRTIPYLIWRMWNWNVQLYQANFLRFRRLNVIYHTNVWMQTCYVSIDDFVNLYKVFRLYLRLSEQCNIQNQHSYVMHLIGLM